LVTETKLGGMHMSIVILKSNMVDVRNADTETNPTIFNMQGSGPDSNRYPNNGPAPAGVTMPNQGGWKDSQSIRSNNATPGRSADLPMGNGPIPGK
jgi:uncharacterized protein YraI